MSEHADDTSLADALDTVLEHSAAVPAPDPGVYHGLESETYFAWPLFSHSASKSLERSPAHCQQEKLTPRKMTDALRVGDCIHAALLEPARFAEVYRAAPKFDRRTKDGKAGYADFIASLPNGAKVVNQSDLVSATGVAKAVGEHKSARFLLENCIAENREISLVWDDKGGNLRVKGRVDAYIPKFNFLVDLKTTEDAGPAGFGRSIIDHRYYRQLAFYRRGLRSHGLEVGAVVIIAVEKEPPYGVACYEVTRDLLAAGDREIEPLMRVYAECERTGVWPCYSQSVQLPAVPSWFQARL